LSFEKSDLKTQIGAWPDKGALATLKRAAKDACVRGVVCESEAHIIMTVFLSFEFSKDRFENSIVFFLRYALYRWCLYLAKTHSIMAPGCLMPMG
jgi:hypothetical protein